ncbi:LysR family transcriptional regulator [Pseudomonas sp. BN102]|uniref:LysR family transcriptional regulator n=1 Tax=Pseudomonas sp. BN102 TaxID=2567886 RepID=UPI0024539F71|nr:LysR family transcriptional regulator [Pseudomonas sp. BN102]MDH4611561.1 LysR family transcriptional regulator [Pseudomonas sp. BN102]
MSWSIDDVPVFVAVVEQQGVTAAAEFLNMPKSSVSRCISRLEEGLGVRLLERNSRNVRVTSEGKAFYHHCMLIMEQVEAANAQMAGLTSIPRGRLSVAMPMAFSREIVGGRLAEFSKRYPLINLEVVVTSHNVDVIRDQIDIALVIGSLDDSELVAQTLLETSLVWITSPDYAAVHPLDGGIEDLVPHIRVCEKRYGQARLSIRNNGTRQTIDLTGVMHINDPLMVREMVIEGAGVSLCPLIYCRPHIERGRLVQVYPELNIEATAVISAVYSSRRLLSNKARAFIEFIKQIAQST